jgi:hypothetical protein
VGSPCWHGEKLKAKDVNFIIVKFRKMATKQLLQTPKCAQQIFSGAQQQRRTLFKPPANVPYTGIYRTNGEICRQDDILVVQRRMNYHPGANVKYYDIILYE